MAQKEEKQSSKSLTENVMFVSLAFEGHLYSW